jgi:hypothetical protein
MGAKSFSRSLNDWVSAEYRDFDRDLFAAFIVRMIRFTNDTGYSGLMTSFVWMFISSFEHLRRYILGGHALTSLVQLHYDAFAGAAKAIAGKWHTRLRRIFVRHQGATTGA